MAALGVRGWAQESISRSQPNKGTAKGSGRGSKFRHSQTLEVHHHDDQKASQHVQVRAASAHEAPGVR
eukprot:1944374-Alexandrium_andersonii.AAC.1